MPKKGWHKSLHEWAIISAISDRNSANLSLLITWQPSSSLLGKGVLSYQPTLSGGINRASPEMEEQSGCQPANNPGPWQITLKSNRNESRVCHPSFQKPRSKPTELDSQIHCLTLVDPVIYNPKTDWSQFETTLFFRKTKLKSLHN